MARRTSASGSWPSGTPRSRTSRNKAFSQDLCPSSRRSFHRFAANLYRKARLGSDMSRATLGWIVLGWIVLGWIGYVLLPWYGFDSAAHPSVGDYVFAGSGLMRGITGAWWLLPILVPLLVALRPTMGSSGG